MSDETCKEQLQVAALFQSLRFDERTHLGLGDIRLTMGDQEIVIAEIERLRRELAETKEQLRLANIDQVNTEAELAEVTAERDRLRAAVEAALAVAIGCKGRIALTFFHVDKIRAALGEDGGNG